MTTRKSDKEIIEEFIFNHHVAVLATVNPDALPEAAVVGISLQDDFQLVFGTYDYSRKHYNLSHNPKVAFVIGWDQGKTVQYEGTATLLDAKAVEEFEEKSLSAMPTVAKYVKEKNSVFYIVKPTWIKYVDVSLDPWDEIDLKFI